MPANTGIRKRRAASMRVYGIFSGELHDLETVASASREAKGEPGRVGYDGQGKTFDSR